MFKIKVIHRRRERWGRAEMAPRSDKGQWKTEGATQSVPNLLQVRTFGLPRGRLPLAVALDAWQSSGKEDSLALEGARHCSAQLSTSPEDLTIDWTLSGSYSGSAITWSVQVSQCRVPLQTCSSSKPRTHLCGRAGGRQRRE